MKTKHTPFQIESDMVGAVTELHHIRNAAGEPVGMAFDHGTARLFAAAPDLLEACKSMIAYAGKYAMEGYGDPVHKQMLAAVAKAEGGER